MLRKTVLTTAIIGAGLASTTGAAFAGDAPGDHHGSDGSDRSTSSSSSEGGCSNTVLADNENGAGRALADVLGGTQAIITGNICDFANGNSIGNGNNVSALGGSVVNGDTTSVNSSTASGTGSSSLIGGVLGG